MILMPRYINYVCAILIAAGSLSISDTAEGLVVDRVIATVGSEVITFADYRLFAKSMGDYMEAEEIDPHLLKNMIEERIMLQEAERKGIDATDWEVEMMIVEVADQSGFSIEDMESFMLNEGISIDAYRKIMKEKIMVSKLIDSDVDSKIIIGDEEVDEFYLSNRSMFLRNPEKTEVKAIFLKLGESASVTEITDLKLKALKIGALLKEGDNFDRLVDEYSDEPMKSHGGMLGQFQRGVLVPELDKAVSSLQEGQTSDPVWVSEGAYILQLVRRLGESFKPVDEARGEIIDNLRSIKRDKLFNEWMKTLWEKSSVKINQN
jgi:peptidyl-prolyl cis-trans isomerase SurA